MVRCATARAVWTGARASCLSGSGGQHAGATGYTLHHPFVCASVSVFLSCCRAVYIFFVKSFEVAFVGATKS